MSQEMSMAMQAEAVCVRARRVSDVRLERLARLGCASCENMETALVARELLSAREQNARLRAQLAESQQEHLAAAARLASVRRTCEHNLEQLCRKLEAAIANR